jgi:hypothetical protein
MKISTKPVIKFNNSYKQLVVSALAQSYSATAIASWSFERCIQHAIMFVCSIFPVHAGACTNLLPSKQHTIRFMFQKNVLVQRNHQFKRDFCFFRMMMALICGNKILEQCLLYIVLFEHSVGCTIQTANYPHLALHVCPRTMKKIRFQV